MMSWHVRHNRIALMIAAGVMLAAGLFVSARLLASPKPALLMMNVLNDEPPVVLPAAEHFDVAAPVDGEAPAATMDADLPPDAAISSDIRWFNNRPVRPVRTMTMIVTGYSPDERSCGASADGITASGYSVWTNGMKLVAADTRVLPFGSLVSVPGYGEDGEIVPVLDRGGKIKGNRLDVLFPTHEMAMQWGVRTLDVVVWEYADGLPADFRTQHARR